MPETSEITNLPRLIFIADGFTRPDMNEKIVTAARAGATWIHLRDHDSCAERFESKAEDIIQSLHVISRNIMVSINSQWKIARKLQVHLHLGRHAPPLEAVTREMKPGTFIGYSAHSVEEAIKASRNGAKYVFLSPIFTTPSKPGHPGLGADVFRALKKRAPGTIAYALGGITPQKTGVCVENGAYGVAVLSGIRDAPDPAEAVKNYLKVLQPGSEI